MAANDARMPAQALQQQVWVISCTDGYYVLKTDRSGKVALACWSDPMEMAPVLEGLKQVRPDAIGVQVSWKYVHEIAEARNCGVSLNAAHIGGEA